MDKGAILALQVVGGFFALIFLANFAFWFYDNVYIPWLKTRDMGEQQKNEWMDNYFAKIGENDDDF